LGREIPNDKHRGLPAGRQVQTRTKRQNSKFHLREGNTMSTGLKMIKTSVLCVAGMLLPGGQVMAAAPVLDLTKDGKKRR